MTTTIYLDVLFLINLFVTYLLLSATCRLSKRVATQKRLIFSSLLGGLSSFSILFYNVPQIILTIGKLLFSALLIFVLFGKIGRKDFVKSLLLFYTVNFIFAGFLFAVWYLLAPTGMVLRNGVVYFPISAIWLCISTMLAYGVIWIFDFFHKKQIPPTQLVQLKIFYHQAQTTITALVDSGNQLFDPISGLPVLVCEASSVSAFFSSETLMHLEHCSLDKITDTGLQKSFRLIPIHTANGQSLSCAFKPDKILLLTTHDSIEKHGFIAICSETFSNDAYQALVGLDFV